MPGHRVDQSIKNTRGISLIEWLIALALVLLLVLVLAGLLKAQLKSYTYSFRQTFVLANARQALESGGSRRGMAAEARSALSSNGLNAAQLSLALPGSLTSLYSLSGDNLLMTQSAQTQTLAKNITAVQLSYYNMNAAGLIMVSTQAASVSLVTAWIQSQQAGGKNTRSIPADDFITIYETAVRQRKRIESDSKSGILAAVSIMSIALYRSTSAMIRESVYQKRLAQAQAIAEAGLEDALLQLRLNPGWRTGFNQKSFAGGAYTVTLSTALTPSITSNGVSASIAIIGPARDALSAQASMTAYGCTTFTDNNATINGFIDAYDSTISTTPASFGFGGHFCSNNKFTLMNQGTVSVHMDVDYNANPAPDAALIEGVVTKTTFTYTLPSSDGTPFVNANNNNKLSLTYYTAATKTLSIPANSTYLMPNGTYYFNGLTVNGNLQVNTTAAAVVMYLNTDFTLPNRAPVHNGEITNLSGIPSRLAIYPQGGSTISLQSKAPVYAVVESSTSNITIGQTFYGNLVGHNITVQSPEIFHFDIQSTNVTPARVTWTLGSWSSAP